MAQLFSLPESLLIYLASFLTTSRISANQKHGVNKGKLILVRKAVYFN